MKLITYPFPVARAFGTEFERLIGARTFADVDRLLNTASSKVSRQSVDLYEDDRAYHVQIELPGIKKDAVSVELDRDRLSVSLNEGSTDERAPRQAWNRVFSVPENTEPNGVIAKLEDGILTVTLPKAEKAQPFRIEIG